MVSDQFNNGRIIGALIRSKVVVLVRQLVE